MTETRITGADILKAFLQAKGWTQRRLAEEANVTQPTITNLLRGDRPEVGTLAKLRQVRGLGGLQPEHFVGGDAS